MRTKKRESCEVRRSYRWPVVPAIDGRDSASSKAPLLRGLLVLLLLAVVRPATALDYQVHGYAAQGFVLSGGNNVFGDSTHGSINYYEAGINGSVQPCPNLLFAAQAAIRDAGITDNGVPRLDYALGDYRFLSGSNADAGLRLGWVKNPLGFFNETRDVIFTRPSILLPSGYGENQGTRSLLFAAQGVQLYADTALGEHELSLTGTFSRNRGLSESQKQLLIDLDGAPFNLHTRDSWNARIMDSIDGGRWQIAYSHFYARFLLTTDPSIDVFGNFDVDLDFFSLRYNARKFSITSEYVLNTNKDFVTQSGVPFLVDTIHPDAAYLQGDYRLSSTWGLMARIDANFQDQSDRSGRRYADAHPGTDPASQFAYDFTAGVHWQSGRHWGAWAEFHRIYGTSTVQSLDNVGRIPDDHWSLFMLMIGYMF
jgi:hypothetical protein